MIFVENFSAQIFSKIASTCSVGSTVFEKIERMSYRVLQREKIEEKVLNSDIWIDLCKCQDRHFSILYM